MKAKNVLFFLALVLVLFQGCIPSLHPLYTKDKLVTKAAIAGVWVDSIQVQEIPFSNEKHNGTIRLPRDKAPVWHFKENADQSYSLVYYDEQGTPASFDAHLIKLGADYFFNFFPRMPTDEEKQTHPGIERPGFNELEAFHYFQVNTFAKVSLKEDQLSISLFDGDFLKKLLDQNRIRIKHEKIDDRYILTAPPAELQKFILKYANDEKAFPEPMVLVKPI